MNRRYVHAIALLVLIFLCGGQVCAQRIYADSVVSNTSDFRNPEYVADGDLTNYARLSRLLGILTSSSLRVQFPQKGKAGDAVFVTLRGSGELLGTGLLNRTELRLYDSAGTQVAAAGGSSLLQLALVTPGDSLYALRYITDIAEDYTFTEAEVIFTDLLSLTLLSELRVYHVFFESSCPPVYADSVYAFKQASGLLDPSFVSNPGNAVDADPDSRATLHAPLNLVGLIPPAYLDLKFVHPGRAGSYVGFTIGAAGTLLDLGLLEDIQIQLYDAVGGLIQTENGFTLADLKLLPGTGDRYTIGFVSQPGSYTISRLRITLSAEVGLLQDLHVYNAFHYAIDRPPVTVTASGPLTLCGGGSVTLTAFDSLGATNYVWNTGATGPSLVVSQPGVYTVEVTDEFSCTRQSVPLEVRVVPVPKPTITGDTLLCQDAGGLLWTTTSYSSYSWSDGTTGDTLMIGAPGTYMVTVTDSNGCQGSDTVDVRAHSNPLTLTIDSILHVSCTDSLSGAVQITVSGGLPPYVYLWSNGQTTEDLDHIGVGTYSVSVTDGYGCVAETAVEVVIDTVTGVVIRIDSVRGAGCLTGSSGAIYITPVSGTAPYTYAWSNGSGSPQLEHVQPGRYHVSVTDANGCRGYREAEVVVDTSIALLVVVDSVLFDDCRDADAGAIYVSVSRGVPPYGYSWSTGATAQDLVGVAPGSYTLTVSDAAGCLAGIAAIVDEAPNLVIAETVTPISCQGDNDGAIQISVTGGSGNYEYNWSNGGGSDRIENLAAGSYTVSITDIRTACTVSEAFVLEEPELLAGAVAVTNDTCTPDPDGRVLVIPEGGTTPYTYSWSSGGAANELSGLAPGIYEVVVTDAHGCTETFRAEVRRADCGDGIDVFNLLTPNSDGNNDFWVIKGIENYPDNEVVVFDKWGDVVFRQKNYQNNWSGVEGIGGRSLPDGTYFYLIKLNASNGNKGSDSYTGSLLIQR